METKDIIGGLQLLKAAVEWDYPLECCIYIGKAIEVLEEFDKQQSFDNSENF